MTSRKERLSEVDRYLRFMFSEVSREGEGVMRILRIPEHHKCEYCSGEAHYDSSIHNEGLAWHYLCEICMSTIGQPEYAIRLIHLTDCDYCAEYLTWDKRQSVLPF